MAGLALAWLLAQDEITAVVVGPGRPEHLDPSARRSRGADRAEAAQLTEVFA